MNIRDYLRILRRNALIVIGCVVLVVGGATAASLLASPVYEATTKVFVSTPQASTVNDLSQGNSFTQQVVKSYAEIVPTPIVLDPVIRDLQLDTTAQELASRVTASAATSTVVLDITVSDHSAKRAADIANAVARQLSATVTVLTHTATASSGVIITTVQQAAVPTAPASPRVLLNLLLALVGGLILGVLAAVARDRLDTRVRGEEDLASFTEAPVLGRILFDKDASTHPLVTQQATRSVRAEAFRSLRTNLEFVDFDEGRRSFVITSAVQGEGKSTSAANLALTLAETGESVVLVDADLRRPRLDDYLGLSGGVGLTDLLIEKVGLDDALLPFANGLTVLTAGSVPPNPSKLIQSVAMTNLLAELERRFTYVVVDAPPLLPVSDAALLAKRTSGAILICAAGRAKTPQVARSLAALEQVGAVVHGVVLTMLPTRGPDSYGYGAYQYEHETKKSAKTSKSDRKVRVAPTSSEPEAMLEAGAAGGS